jgi:hypothetical protein
VAEAIRRHRLLPVAEMAADKEAEMIQEEEDRKKL